MNAINRVNINRILDKNSNDIKKMKKILDKNSNDIEEMKKILCVDFNDSKSEIKFYEILLKKLNDEIVKYGILITDPMKINFNQQEIRDYINKVKLILDEKRGTKQ